MRDKLAHPIVCWIGVSALVLALMLPGASLAQGTSALRVSPATAQVAIGSTVSIHIAVETVSNLSAAEAHLTFDPALLEVVDADPGTSGVQVALGPFLSPVTVTQNTVNQSAGQIDFAFSSGTPVDGDGTVATITFRGDAAGDSAITFTASTLTDNVGSPIAHDTSNGQVTVIAAETPTSTSTPPDSPLNTPTPTSTTAPTSTPTPTSTAGPTSTSTSTPTPTPTSTTGPTSTSTPTSVPGATNTPTPTPTSTPTPAEACDNPLGNHVVRVGETLYSIGRAYGVRPDYIAHCNNIVSPNLIHPNVTLKIPNARWFPIPPGPTAVRQFGDSPPTPAPTCAHTHVVQAGQNLFRISLHYGVSMWVIAEANHIYNLNYILIGQVLCIP